jgi:hypothetical protein
MMMSFLVRDVRFIWLVDLGTLAGRAAAKKSPPKRKHARDETSMVTTEKDYGYIS